MGNVYAEAADTAQVDRILSEVDGLGEKDKILFFHKVGEMFGGLDARHGGGVSIESAFGLWKDRGVTEGTLREKAWKKI